MTHRLFSPEHEMLRRTIRAFVEKEVAPHVREWEEAERIPRELWRRLGELGFLGLEFPPEYGGGGADFLSTLVFAEEMARCRSGGVAFSVLVHTDMSSPWLIRFGAEAQKRQYLPGIIKGQIICALGITEPGAGSDMAGLATRAVRDGDHYVIAGSKMFITNGVYGDLYFVAARTGPGTPERRHEGISMFLVERGTPGLVVSRKLDKMGMRASDTAELSFQECRVPAENLLGEPGRGFYQLSAGLQRERLVAAILALSGARQALEDTIAYVKNRQAFGEPLSRKQAVRHRLADMATEIEAAQALVYRAAELYNAGEEPVTEISMAKLFATEVANRVAYHAVQLHGGYGYMREFPVEGFFRDVRLWTIASGTSEIMREIVARRLAL
jgi:alkylation response protein AidB-like acyl-CoA dehydrogenase